MRGDYWIPKQEDLITQFENNCMATALEDGYSVISDATNLNKDRVKARVKFLLQVVPGLNVEYRDFDASVETCIRRDLKRANSVGSDVIRGMHNRYKENKDMYKPNPALRPAYIFDVDGTLAEMKDRSPYEWDKVGLDTPKNSVINILKKIGVGADIVICTGRDGSCEEETKHWLIKNGVEFDDFYIRFEGDNRKDSIIKHEMYMQIKEKYNILGVFDDRDQVVRMWRELGIPCYQVDYGDF